MDLQLRDRTAVVTGSTAGIGRAIAAALVAEGARVIISGRTQDKAERVATELVGPGQCFAIAADLAEPVGVRQLMASADRLGPVDILVNNLGIFEPKSFEAVTDEDWQRFFNLNVLSAIRCTREVLGGMRSRGWGRILFISSESGINIPQEMIHYGMTKAAMLAVSRGLAKHLADSGVTVNALLPGPTWTEGVADFLTALARDRQQSLEDCKEEFFRSARPDSLIQRFLQPAEVARLAVYLCSPLADGITGSAQRVDGGIVNTCF